MRSWSIPSGVSALLVLFQGASALVARGPRTPTPSVSSFLGSATDYPDLGRDGGGGASVNGINVMFFADTAVSEPSNPSQLVPGGWATNSYTFIEDPENPLQQTNFGQSLGDGFTIPDMAVNWTAAEDVNWGAEMLWGGSMATQRNDPAAAWGYLIFQYGLRPTCKTCSYTWEYNTLVNVTATKSGGLVTTRIVPELFPASDLLWGSFALAGEPSTDYLYLFAGSGMSLYVARVDWASATDVNSYEYYSGSDSWSASPSSRAPIITLPPLTVSADGSMASGNVFWSPFYETRVAIYMTNDQDDFWLTYSTTGSIQGPYSYPVDIFATCAGCGNYAGSAYPYWRGPDASEVILSWSVNGGAETQMALVTFT